MTPVTFDVRDVLSQHLTIQIQVTVPALQPGNHPYFLPMPGSPLPVPGLALKPAPGGFTIPELVFP